MIKLTPEQRQAVQQNPQGIAVEDDSSHKVYVILDSETHRKAMQALRQIEDLEAIHEGLGQLSNGEGIPLEEADRQMREQLGFPPS